MEVWGGRVSMLPPPPIGQRPWPYLKRFKLTPHFIFLSAYPLKWALHMLRTRSLRYICGVIAVSREISNIVLYCIVL